jgi:hypothetical protein
MVSEENEHFHCSILWLRCRLRTLESGMSGNDWISINREQMLCSNTRCSKGERNVNIHFAGLHFDQKAEVSTKPLRLDQVGGQGRGRGYIHAFQLPGRYLFGISIASRGGGLCCMMHYTMNRMRSAQGFVSDHFLDFANRSNVAYSYFLLKRNIA